MRGWNDVLKVFQLEAACDNQRDFVVLVSGLVLWQLGARSESGT